MGVPEATFRDEAAASGEPSSRVRSLALAPVLLVGAPRSGTTWLQRTLLSMPECCGGQESHALCTVAKVVGDFERKAAMERPHGLAAHLTRDSLVDQMRSLWVAAMRSSIEATPHAIRLLEKTPDHAVHLDLADELLPESKAIHLVRDPRDVVASLIAASRRSWGAGWAPSTVEGATRRWIECVDAAEASGRRLGPARFLRVRYEDLLRAPESALAKVLGFLDLPPDRSADRLGLLMAAAENGGAEIPIFGELSGRTSVEPEGFVGGSRPLGGLARRRVTRLVGSRLAELGFEPDTRREPDS